MPTNTPGTPTTSTQNNPLLPPPTQNTAPVLKHRCLFTHDTRRKAKRWQDGYVRYHTFNKRVMTYDTAGNFIGDLHWRQDDVGIQDGDELELDRGVLVQVCEAVGRSETDVSFVLNSSSHGGRGAGGSGLGAGAGAGTQSSLYTASPASSWRSQSFATGTGTATPSLLAGRGTQVRSLNEVLGVRRGVPGDIGMGINTESGSGSGNGNEVGTGIGVLKHGQSLGDRVVAAPAAKRQRIAGLKSSPPAEEGRLSAQQLHRQAQTPSRRVQPVQPVQSRPRAAVVDLTGPSTAAPVSTTPPNPRHQKADSRAGAPQFVATKSAPSKESASASPSLEPSRKDSASASPLPPSRKDSVNPLQPPRKETTNPASHPQPRPAKPEDPPTLLRLSTSKPRKKLMYSALLPGGGGQAYKPASAASVAPAPAAAAAPRNNKTPAPPAQPSSTTTSSSSSSSSTTKNDFTPSTSTQNILNDLINAPPRPPNPTLTTKQTPTHGGLRKSYSDPTALTTRTTTTASLSFHSTTGPRLPTIPEPDPADQGPWTREALDLFEFWPAGRAKPV
ncbi:uncharacterized protein BO97DRAFT_480922 [Aspergillus homomorphus CBS 101889]|uniref:5'-3' DNA helicase ZGRF1-like N-terminal domain-containing protein n=1 Tax=Aspergillus homomorphus (strain CBS 101889) TaxID=1450537 RepID=A0A395HMA2_ASPHC|nr:hypothetical protein BO97DRAFT_480922 [Aspergillus homomorphus CBS 101889]RAL07988.1 hypothetical protein BO97DRAFT_480922 [Aspergillus homomorphus CBS 101889]